jgi:hypothetical protein
MRTFWRRKFPKERVHGEPVKPDYSAVVEELTDKWIEQLTEKMMEPQTCKRCPVWTEDLKDKDDKDDKEVKDIGRCRYNPPVVMIKEGVDYSTFPITASHHWCKSGRDLMEVRDANEARREALESRAKPKEYGELA